ncbi:MAG: DUF262 domain-containing protein [Limnoraphis sp.]
MSIIPQGMSILFLYDLYRKNRLIVNRRYQRKLVWTKEEKELLIESILLKYPIPLILFGKFNNNQKGDTYEIIDGMQRLNAIFGFIENQFSVNGKFFDVTKAPLAYELSKSGIFKVIYDNKDFLNASDCIDFLNYSLAVTIYQANSQEDIENVFNRINSNGKHLSPQEVRQAGVTTKFSGLVRSLASEIRGDVSREILPLTEMPGISIDAKSIDLGYGIHVDDTFWCNQGIINTALLRDSEDEQIIADIVLSIALNAPFPASKERFDSYYGKGENDKSDEIELEISKYGEDNLKADIKTVWSSIVNAVKMVKGSDDRNFLRKTLNPTGGGNPVKQPFYTLFMAFYELIIKENKEPFDYKNIFDAVYKLKRKLKITSTTTTQDRIANINLTKGLIQNYFKNSADKNRNPRSYVIDFENYLRLSKTEAPHYDFKQGLYNLNSTNRCFDNNNFDKICQNIAAIANLGKGKEGYLFLGVTDKEEDTKRVEKLDNIIAPRFGSFGIVGLEREAQFKETSLDDYLYFISRKIRDSELPEFLKTQINTDLVPINYMDRTVLKLTIKAGDNPIWYKEKLYIRDGHEKKSQEKSGEQIDAVYRLFR